MIMVQAVNECQFIIRPQNPFNPLIRCHILTASVFSPTIDMRADLRI